MADVKKSIALSRKIPAPMKEIILKYVTSSSTYNKGSVHGLKKPIGMGKISKKIWKPPIVAKFELTSNIN
jgi:hypothetical protein